MNTINTRRTTNLPALRLAWEGRTPRKAHSHIQARHHHLEEDREEDCRTKIKADLPHLEALLANIPHLQGDHHRKAVIVLAREAKLPVTTANRSRKQTRRQVDKQKSEMTAPSWAA